MAFEFIQIPAHGQGATKEELNRLLRARRVVSLRKEFVADGEAAPNCFGSSLFSVEWIAVFRLRKRRGPGRGAELSQVQARPRARHLVNFRIRFTPWKGIGIGLTNPNPSPLRGPCHDRFESGGRTRGLVCPLLSSSNPSGPSRLRRLHIPPKTARNHFFPSVCGCLTKLFVEHEKLSFFPNCNERSLE